jgi:hypothetical protein
MQHHLFARERVRVYNIAHTHIHTHMHAPMHTHTHIHTHTHTHTRASFHTCQCCLSLNTLLFMN